MRNKSVVFDIDKTLSWGEQRVHLLPSKEVRNIDSAWDEFNLAAGGDAPIPENIELLNCLSKSYKVIILTARSEVCRGVTEEWLSVNGVIYDELVMRGIGDCRNDACLKAEFLLPMRDEVLCCFDDQPSVCKAISDIGIPCHLVSKPEFL